MIGDDRWVCLLYHDVGKASARPTSRPERFNVTSKSFRAQVELIARSGRVGCSVQTMLETPTHGGLAISFDDGTAGQFETAFPILAAHGMTATFFVTTAWVGQPGHVSWDQLREMKAAGMSIQSHTHTHRLMSRLTEAELHEELRISKQQLDQALEQETTAIALPGGDFPARRWLGLFQNTGYRVVATSRWGWNRGGGSRHGVTWVKRCTIMGCPSDAAFDRILVGDPWLHARRRTRESLLSTTRRLLGPGRYTRWRARVLDAWPG